MARKHSKNHGGGPTRAIEALMTTGVTRTVHEREHDPVARPFGEETVEKLGIDPIQTFKTLMVRLGPISEFVVGCVPVRAHLSTKLIAKAAGAESAAMTDPTVVQRHTSYVMNGISPLGQTTSYCVFIDSIYLGRETIVISDGRRGLSVELSPLDPVELTDAEVTDLTQV